MMRRFRFSLLILLLVVPGAFGKPQEGSSSPPDASSIIHYLGRTIDWYRRTAVEEQMAAELTDVMVVNNNRQLGDQIVRLAFDFARVEAGPADKSASGVSGAPDNSTPTQYQSLERLSAQLDDQIQQNKSRIEELRGNLDSTRVRNRSDIESQIAELQSEINLDNARRTAIQTMSQFVAGAALGETGGTGLAAQIEALARSLPVELSKPAVNDKNLPVSSQSSLPPSFLSPKAEPSGLWGLIKDLVAQSHKLRTLSDLAKRTAVLQQSAAALRAPLVTQLKGLARQGEAFGGQNPTDSAAIAAQKKQIDTLTAQFKPVSAAVLPLAEQGILLDLYLRNLSSWQSAIQSEYDSDLRSLIVRIGVLALILIAVFGGGEILRRAIFRYVHDPHRRYQFLLMRKILMAFVVILVIAFSFASQIGSVATFAGLLTAGVALALQSVIVSIAGYFLLIGRFGIGVGDRVQISGVTGEVVDVGLVRINLMELTPGGSPTGRIVAFANSVVFQSNAGLFKQIPGTNFTWHEVTVTLASDSSYDQAEKRLVPVVEKIYEQYKPEMERQYREMERTLASLPADFMRPRARLRFTSTGLEVAMRFPVGIRNAAEIDDVITRELWKECQKEPQLRLAGAGAAIRISTDTPEQAGSG